MSKQYLVIDESQKGDAFIDQYETLEAANTAAAEAWDKLTAHDRKIHGKRRIYVVQAPDVPEGEYLSDEYLSSPKYFDSDKPQKRVFCELLDVNDYIEVVSKSELSKHKVRYIGSVGDSYEYNCYEVCEYGWHDFVAVKGQERK